MPHAFRPSRALTGPSTHAAWSDPTYWQRVYAAWDGVKQPHELEDAPEPQGPSALFPHGLSPKLQRALTVIHAHPGLVYSGLVPHLAAADAAVSESTVSRLRRYGRGVRVEKRRAKG